MIEGEGEKRKICQDLFEHTTKNKEEIQKKKFQKHSQRNHFFEKASQKGNWQTNIFRRENKEERIPFFFKRVVDSEKHKNKRKEKTNDKNRQNHRKSQKEKFKNRERNKNLYFLNQKIAEGKKSRKTKRDKNISTQKEKLAINKNRNKKQKDGKHAEIIRKRRKIKEV